MAPAAYRAHWISGFPQTRATRSPDATQWQKEYRQNTVPHATGSFHPESGSRGGLYPPPRAKSPPVIRSKVCGKCLAAKHPGNRPHFHWSSNPLPRRQDGSSLLTRLAMKQKRGLVWFYLNRIGR